MNEVTQIRVGKHMTGIIDLDATLVEVSSRCKGLPEETIGKILVEKLSKRNYIPDNLIFLYRDAFMRAYKQHVGEPVEETSGQGLQIKVLGRGCPQCDRMEQEVMAAMAETGIMAELEHVRHPAQIGRYGVMGLPALIIDGEVKAVGSVPPREKINLWIQKAAGKTI